MKKIVALIVVASLMLATLSGCDVAIGDLFKKKCEKDGCDNKRTETSVYCSSHQCAYLYGINPCPNYAPGYAFRYCETHSCKNAFCGEVKYNGLEYCRNHKCNAQHCTRERAINSTEYCPSHACRSCGKYTDYGVSYCLDHKCIIPSCPYQRLGISEGLCSWHRSHP